MASVGIVGWQAYHQIINGSPMIVVVADWDYFDNNGIMSPCQLNFGFSHDPATWERGLWQAIGGTQICRALQIGFEEDENVIFSGRMVH